MNEVKYTDKQMSNNFYFGIVWGIVIGAVATAIIIQFVL